MELFLTIRKEHGQKSLQAAKINIYQLARKTSLFRGCRKTFLPRVHLKSGR